MNKASSVSSNAVSNWLLLGVWMLVVQVLLGGVTRLSGSGLSITEWDVVTGTLPPLNDQTWLQEFQKYKLTPQYKLLNFDFTIRDFKFIFFWEWIHRLWARLMGLVFAVGFVYFLLKQAFNKSMVKSLLILFLLGGLQGAVGWIMVASGLTGDAVYVKPTRLALHFILAMGLLCYTFWFALTLKVKKQQITTHNRTRAITWVLLVLVLVQLLFGALMAGHKAATAAPTWPTIGGQWIPDTLFKDKPLLLNFIENKITIHFFHRNIACLIAVVMIAWYVVSARVKGSVLFQATRFIPLTLVLLQIVLGIISVLAANLIVPNRWGLFETIAQVHQLGGLCMILSLTAVLFLVRKEPS